jgi:hypothetical protein
MGIFVVAPHQLHHATGTRHRRRVRCTRSTFWLLYPTTAPKTMPQEGEQHQDRHYRIPGSEVSLEEWGLRLQW